MENEHLSYHHKVRAKIGRKTQKKDKATSYDTSRKETADPQKVRESTSPEGEQQREKEAKGE